MSTRQKEIMRMYQETFNDYNALISNLYESNINLINASEKKKLYSLFSYLVKNGYTNAAEDLWEKVIRINFIVKPL